MVSRLNKSIFLFVILMTAFSFASAKLEIGFNNKAIPSIDLSQSNISTGVINNYYNQTNLSGYVPYNGATQPVDLGANKFKALEVNINNGMLFSESGTLDYSRIATYGDLFFYINDEITQGAVIDRNGNLNATGYIKGNYASSFGDDNGNIKIEDPLGIGIPMFKEINALDSTFGVFAEDSVTIFDNTNYQSAGTERPILRFLKSDLTNLYLEADFGNNWIKANSMRIDTLNTGTLTITGDLITTGKGVFGADTGYPTNTKFYVGDNAGAGEQVATEVIGVLFKGGGTGNDFDDAIAEKVMGTFTMNLGSSYSNLYGIKVVPMTIDGGGNVYNTYGLYVQNSSVGSVSNWAGYMNGSFGVNGVVNISNGDVYINKKPVSPWLYNQSDTAGSSVYVPYINAIKSVDLGANNLTIDGASVVFGTFSKSDTIDTLTAGYASTTKKVGGIALGYNAYSGGSGAAALGWFANATGDYSFASGSSTKAIGEGSTATGGGTIALGVYSKVSGYFANASGNYSTAFGTNFDCKQNYAFCFSGGNFGIGTGNPTHTLNVVGSENITGNLIIEQNLSVKRPYWNGYNNETQQFKDTNAVQIINISNNNDYDSYGIHVENNQNLTFDMTGDYLCILSPEFYQATGSNKVIAFWYQRKNSTGGMQDVAWTNSRYTMANGEYTAPAIPFQFDITNPATDKVRFMWYSDSTASQIISIPAPTNPTRPGIPSTILNCQKVSEITP